MNEESIVKALVKRYSDKWEKIQNDYIDLYHNVHNKIDQTSQLENALESNLKQIIGGIKDPVLKKQLRTFTPSERYRFHPNTDNVNSLFMNLRYDVDCINNSMIPKWLSNTIYVFNNDWGKAVYDKIVENYCKIIDFAQQQIANKSQEGNLQLQKQIQDSRKIMIEDYEMLQKAIALVVEEQFEFKL